MIAYFFVKDARTDPRLFCSEPPGPMPAKFSKSKEIWEAAKKKLMLLPARTLRQEEALAKALRIPESSVTVLHGAAEEKHINLRFLFFLNKRRSQRLLLLIGEGILAPFTGILALLPGPNIVFYALALVMITHWQSLRGIRALLAKNHEYRVDPLLTEWETAVAEGREADYPGILDRIEKAHGLKDLRKVLWK
ncbi:MAG: hypothetical protein JW843_12300 [Candidatus Aminicenantes bacterium]|nr:hypothetical protein [Candidatus Aminicenantes bacterium]